MLLLTRNAAQCAWRFQEHVEATIKTDSLFPGDSVEWAGAGGIKGRFPGTLLLLSAKGRVSIR